MKTVHSLALSLLDGAADASKRLGDPHDREALHDFRVALRRLHAYLKSYRGSIGGDVSGKLRKRLLKILAATSPVRDAEVELAWLRAREGKPGSALKAGIEWLLQELERRRREGLSAVRGEAVGRFWRVEKKLRKGLAKPVRPGARAGLEAAAGALIRETAAKLAGRLHGRGSLMDLKKIHKLRLTVKRVRYLIEPFKESRKDCAAVLEGLKTLQEKLGELHDGNVFAGEVAAAAEASAGQAARALFDSSGHGTKGAAPFWPERQGLLAVARNIEAERERLLAELKDRWLGRKAEPFLDRLDELARSFSRRASATAKGPAPKARSPRPAAADLQTPAGTPLLSSARS